MTQAIDTMKLELIHQDADLWVFNKPSGMASHPNPALRGIPDVITEAIATLAAPTALAPINRLDRATSGIILCSPNGDVRGELGKAFAEGRVQKTYQALVYGHTHKKGTIKKPLFDKRRKKSLEAETRYKRLETFGSASLLELTPKTGRKHQIRRHLQLIGHSIVGDPRYKPRRRYKLPAFPERLWLHAAKLELEDGRCFHAALPTPLSAQLLALRELRRTSNESSSTPTE